MADFDWRSWLKEMRSKGQASYYLKYEQVLSLCDALEAVAELVDGASNEDKQYRISAAIERAIGEKK